MTKDGEGSDEETELSIEDQIKKEMSEMKKPRTEQRFGALVLVSPGLSSVVLKKLQPIAKRIPLVVGLLRIMGGEVTKWLSVIFISCKPPVDPVELVVKYVESVEKTGASRTR